MTDEQMLAQAHEWLAEVAMFPPTEKLYQKRLATLKWLIEQAEKVERLQRFYNYFAELYGTGLDIANWHQNVYLESFDNFFDAADQGIMRLQDTLKGAAIISNHAGETIKELQHEAETAKEFIYQMIEDKRLLQREIDRFQEELDKFQNDYLAVCRQLAGIKKQYIQTSNKLKKQREVTQKLEEKLQKKRKEAGY